MNDPRSHSKYRRIRREVLAGGRGCVYCGTTGSPDNPMEADHRIPVARGGAAKVKANLQPACRRCNRSKGKRGAPGTPGGVAVFRYGANHTPILVAISLPMRRYATIRGDFTRRTER